MLIKKCLICGKSIKVIPALYKVKKYCSIKCCNKSRIKHGMFGTRFYGIYYKMSYRCSPKHPKRKYYFDKGIAVSKKWEKFDVFMNDMYKSYCKHVDVFGEKNTTIDRVNGNMGYCKSNCRWATYKEQNINRNF